MGRWAPGTAERLHQAALELFATRGFDQTTAADIAEAVGVTERTFFRHFTDKREVLFQGQEEFSRAFLTGLDAVPADAPPMVAIAAAVRAGGVLFSDDRRPYARTRRAVIDQNPALQERERHKLAGLAVALANALRARGVDDLAATLAAEAGVMAFRVAFARWIAEGETRSFDEIIELVLRELSAVTRTPA